MIHEAPHAIPIDLVPGVPARLEMGADHATVRDLQNARDVVDVDAGVGEDRRLGQSFLDAPQCRLVDRLAGERA